MFLVWLRQLPGWGDWIPASVPPPTEGRSIPTNTPVFPPSSFVLPSFAWVPLQYSAWQIPWAEEPGRLQSMGSLGVGHDWATYTLTFYFHALEKEMATHSSVLAWRIPGTGEPGGLLSMGSHRVRHDWSDLAAAYILFHWSGTPAGSQLVFCMHFCVWRCIPDVSVERDELCIHQLLHHLVLFVYCFLNSTLLAWCEQFIPKWNIPVVLKSERLIQRFIGFPN